MRTQGEELSLKNWRRAHHLSTQFTDDLIQSVKHGPGCPVKCRQSTSVFESVIPISKDGCTTIMLWIDMGYQRGIPSYPWLVKLIYCYGIRSSRFNFFAQWICLSVAHCHGWNYWAGQELLAVLVCRALCFCCWYSHCFAWSMSHKAWETMLGIVGLQRAIPTKPNVAFCCLHQREEGKWAS